MLTIRYDKIFDNPLSPSNNNRNIQAINLPSSMTNNCNTIKSYSIELNYITKYCTCKNKRTCPLEGKCRMFNIIYKCTVTKTANSHSKVYIGSFINFKQRF